MKNFLRMLWFWKQWDSFELWTSKPESTKDDVKVWQAFLASHTGKRYVLMLRYNWQRCCEDATYPEKMAQSGLTRQENLTFKAGCANGLKISLIQQTELAREESAMDDEPAQEDSAASLLRRR